MGWVKTVPPVLPASKVHPMDIPGRSPGTAATSKANTATVGRDSTMPGGRLEADRSDGKDDAAVGAPA